MRLYDLLNSIVLQGDIRISKWENDEEKILAVLENCDDLGAGNLDYDTEDLDALYMFAPGDGYLHIEVE